MGCGDEGSGRRGEGAAPWRAELDLLPIARWPTRLNDATVAAVLAAPLLRASAADSTPIAAGPPRVSVVVVTLDNLVFNRLCLESLLDWPQEANCEIIVVDNGSTDGTAEYLRQLRDLNPSLRVIFNDSNMGFAASNNRALSKARGDVLVLLNNDTIAPPGALDRLLSHLGDPGVGLVGPVTNRSGNEAQIETSYRTCGEMLTFAADRAREHCGEQSELRVATMFCAAMRRTVFEQIGPLDEQFEIGLFEDDDYSMQVRRAGYRVVCAEDVFVHHFGQASIGKLAAAGRYGELFHANRRRWEAKWGQPWEAYRMRVNPVYKASVAQMRAELPRLLPPGAKVLVVSKGDDALLEMPGLRAEHFPQDERGDYCGYNPASGNEAVQMLEALRQGGAEFLLIPRASLWWLDYYGELKEHLEKSCRANTRRLETCVVYDLRQRAPDACS